MSAEQKLRDIIDAEYQLADPDDRGFKPAPLALARVILEKAPETAHEFAARDLADKIRERVEEVLAIKGILDTETKDKSLSELMAMAPESETWRTYYEACAQATVDVMMAAFDHSAQTLGLTGFQVGWIGSVVTEQVQGRMTDGKMMG